MKQLEFNFSRDCTPTFKEWLSEVNHEHSKHGEKTYSLEEGKSIYAELVKKDFFNKCSNVWNNRGTSC